MNHIVSLIAAVASNGTIGYEGQLPWYLPEDLRRFRDLTMGKPVVMGRLTYESIGRPLDGRRNIVITSRGTVAHGCELAKSFEHALELTAADPEVMVIGGDLIFESAINYASRMYLTLVEGNFIGNKWFPPWTEAWWKEVSRESRPPTESAPGGYHFVVLERIAGGVAQLAARRALNPQVGGSSPPTPSI